MSGIIHMSGQPSALRRVVMGLALAAAAAGGAQMAGLFDAAAPAAPVAPSALTAPVVPGSLRDFPDVRFRLLEVGPGAGPTRTARIEIEGRVATHQVGQEVFPGIVLSQLASDHMVLSFGSLTRSWPLVRDTAQLSSGLPLATAPAATAEERNAKVDVRRLTHSRFMTAQSFLGEVELAPHPRGGFVVQAIVADSLYERAGLRVGDVLYSLDTANSTKINDTSMEEVMRQTHYELDVFRNGTPVQLRYRLPTSDPEPEGGTAAPQALAAPETGSEADPISSGR